MRCVLSSLIIAACFAVAGCSSKPKVDGDIGPAVGNDNWRLNVDVLTQGSEIRVTLTNVSGKPLRAYEVAPIASLHLLSDPGLPIPVAEAVTLPTSELVKPGGSLESEIELDHWFELADAKAGEYVCRLSYSDELFNSRIRPDNEDQRSQVGRLSSDVFGFTIRNGAFQRLWYRDSGYDVMPQENGLAMWPVLE